MCTIEIPYFKELIVMSFVCDYCGAHSTEVKPGGFILLYLINIYYKERYLKKVKK